MRHSTDRILVSHAGNLPRPEYLDELIAGGRMREGSNRKEYHERLPKAVAAARRISRVNSEVRVTPVVADVNFENIEEIIAGADLVIDGTDNFETRYLINDACVKTATPWIYGAAVGSYGLTMTILPGETPCLRCVLEAMPAPGSAGMNGICVRTSARPRASAVSARRTITRPGGAFGPTAVRTKVTASSRPSNSGLRVA